jgi:hypothetical protein
MRDQASASRHEFESLSRRNKELELEVSNREKNEKRLMDEIDRLQREMDGNQDEETRFNMVQVEKNQRLMDDISNLEGHLIRMIRDSSIPVEEIIPKHEEDFSSIVSIFESACQPRPELMTGTRKDLITMREEFFTRFRGET